jgi:hypothetical protein
MSDEIAQRRIYTKDERAALVSRFKSSGLSQQQFVSENGLNLTTFQSWIYRKQVKRLRQQPIKFREINAGMSPVNSRWAAEIELRAGITARFTVGLNPLWIGSVVRELSKSC